MFHVFIENRLWLPREQRGGKYWKFGISRCKLAYINKVLLYSMGNYIQYPVLNHNGKENKKQCVYMCIYIYIYIYTHTHIYIYMYACMMESPCYRLEINATLKVSYNKIFKKYFTVLRENIQISMTQYIFLQLQIHLTLTLDFLVYLNKIASKNFFKCKILGLSIMQVSQ